MCRRFVVTCFFWIKQRKKMKKVAAIGIRIKKWIAYHGFSININTDINKFKKIIPCGINNCALTNLYLIKKQSYKDFSKKYGEGTKFDLDYGKLLIIGLCIYIAIQVSE